MTPESHKHFPTNLTKASKIIENSDNVPSPLLLRSDLISPTQVINKMTVDTGLNTDDINRRIESAFFELNGYRKEVPVHIYIYICIKKNIYIYIYIQITLILYLYIYMYMYRYVYTCVFLYVYMYTVYRHKQVYIICT